MSTPGGTPHHSDAEEEPKEEGKLRFEDADMENVHVRTKRMIAAQKRRETTTTDKLEEDIRKAKEKGPSNMSVTEKNLLKAKIDSAIEELKATKTKKNELLDKIHAQL